MGRLGHQAPCSCRCLLLAMCLREKEKETGLAEAHDGDWDAERGPRLQWTGTQDEGGALQVLELQKSVLKEADCLHEESDA